jgi:hypothetical protein
VRTLLASCLVLAAFHAAAADPLIVYKYRMPDGRMQYSDKPIRGGELIEAFEYTPPPAPTAIRPEASKSDAAGLERIKKHLTALEAAWREVQESGRALEAAVARRETEAGPSAGEVTGLSSPGPTAPPTSAGGPGDTVAPPSAGGPGKAAPPAAGGPMSDRRGGGRRPEYFARIAKLDADVDAARKRNQQAWERYNKLR